MRRLAFLSALCPVFFPTRAEAEPEWSGGIGAFFGVAFGKSDGLAWGFEAFGMRMFEVEQCSSLPRSGVGPLVQFAMVGTKQSRLTVALHAGKEVSRDEFASVTGEVGATYRLGSDGGYGLHLGFTPEWFLFNASLRGQLFLDEYSVTAGVRFLPTYGASRCSIGRPLRAHEGLVPVSDRACRVALPVRARRPAPQNEAAGRTWERDAQLECASVPAFLQLAAELLAHDAPLSLVERALDAACDEIRHARSCAEMASRNLGYDVWPTLPDFRRRPVPSVAQLAEESWIDGCLGEGAAAKRAARDARLARDGRTKAVHARIAKDETRHAELAWDILRWTLDRAGPAAREAVGSATVAREFLDGHAIDCIRRRDDLLALR